MLLTVPISPGIEVKLKAKAAGAGIDVQTLAAHVLERFASRPTLDEVLAPLRREFENSGMSEEQLTDLLETAKHEMRADRRNRRAS